MTVTLSILTALIAVGYASRVYLRRDRNPLLAIYMFLLAFVVLYCWSLNSAAPTITMIVGSDVLLECQVIVLLGLIMTLLGYELTWGALAKRLRYLDSEVDLSRLGRYGCLLFLAGVAGELAFIALSGGPAVYFARSRGAGAYADTTAYIYYSRWLWVPALAFMAVAGSRIRLWAVATVVGWMALLGYNLVLGQRTGIIVAIMFAAGCVSLWSKRRLGVAVMGTVVAVGGIIIGLVKETRSDFYVDSTFSASRSLEEHRLGSVVKNALSQNFSEGNGVYDPTTPVVMFASFVNVVPSLVDFDYGAYYCNYLFAWIPRAIWATRPDLFLAKKETLDRAVGFLFRGGPTWTMLGMYYLNGGYLGICGLCYLTGAWLAFVDLHGKKMFVSATGATLFLSLLGRSLSLPTGLGILADMQLLLPFTLVPVVAGLVWSSRGRRRRWSGLARPRATGLGQSDRGR